MPELPEVETIRRSLEKSITGKTLKSFWTDWPKKVSPSPATFKQEILGKKITGVSRRAKILIMKLTGGRYLLFHLKLTGQLIYKPKTKNSKPIYGGHPQPGGLDNLPNKFTHYSFTFSDGSILFFNDLRKFGWVKLVSEEAFQKIIGPIGLEPLDDTFTFLAFRHIVKRYPNRSIKQILMDQALISGIGNIYADESLFLARIRPTRRAKRIRERELRLLRRSIIALLKKAIQYRGTSTDSIYRQIDGAPGQFAQFLNVYGRGKDNCKKCKKPLSKIKLNGRGTHYCPFCQK